MEKFYIVTDKSKLRQEYIDHEQNIKDVNEVVKVVMDNNRIEAKEYCIDNFDFAVLATKADIEKFPGQFRKNPHEGCPCYFKKTSKVYKEMYAALYEKELKVQHKPMIQFYFHTYGKSRSRLFAIDNVVYASYESERDFNNPEGFQEIAGSEFYRIIEDYNNKIKSKTSNN